MSKTYDIWKKVSRFEKDLEDLINPYGYFSKSLEDQLNECDPKTPDEILLVNEMNKMKNHLSEIYYKLEYLNKPVKLEGNLIKRQDGRYGIGDEYFTSGSTIEVFVSGGEYDPDRWALTSVEHNGEDYYIVLDPKRNMEGLYIRVRGR